MSHSGPARPKPMVEVEPLLNQMKAARENRYTKLREAERTVANLQYEIAGLNVGIDYVESAAAKAECQGTLYK